MRLGKARFVPSAGVVTSGRAPLVDPATSAGGRYREVPRCNPARQLGAPRKLRGSLNN
jgi:hypothetical protein